MRPSLSSAIVALSLLAATSQAGAVGRLADVNVHDRDSGQQLKLYLHRGQYYVVGTPGNRYAVSIRNPRGERIMTVVSVDGVNVVSGETAAPNQTGYVLDPYGATEINGWRKTMNEVASFVFSQERDSYAARTDRPDHVGVIGTAVFREKPAPVRRRSERIAPSAPAAESAEPYARDSNTAGASAETARQGMRKAQPAPRLGTAHGQRETSEIEYTDFVRASTNPDEVISIRYDSYRNLVAKGIIRSPRPAKQADPDPFPGRFVPDPR